MKQLRATLLGGMVLLAAQMAWAAPVTGLYQVRESFEDVGEEARAEAFSRAFVTLMQRLTGTAGSAENRVLAAHKANPKQLALGYTYQDDELQVSFDPASVMQVLRDAQVPVWGTDRPMLLLWWVQENFQGRQLLGDGQNRSINLQQAGLHRGLPIRFPLADLSEQVQADHGWRDAGEQLTELLQRYGADALLVVESKHDADGVTGTWQLLGTEENLKGQLAGSNAMIAADGMFQTLAHELAQDYAIVPGQGNAVRVRLQGLDMDGMLAAERALQVFDGQLVSLDGEQAVWQVTAVPEQLRSQLALYQFRELPVAADDGLVTQTELIFVR